MKKGKRLRHIIYYLFKFTVDENYQERLGRPGRVSRALPFKSKWQGGGKNRQQMDRKRTIKDLGKEKVLFGKSFLRRRAAKEVAMASSTADRQA